MNPIDATFQQLRTEGRKAFIPFITAGDPDLDSTARLLSVLAKEGASLIEIGFPYSDPIADGPIIQASYTRALARGVRVDQIFESVKNASLQSRLPPLIAMVSFTLVHRRGFADFIRDARAAGFSGTIVPDLPIEEAEEFARLAADAAFSLILLVTPTTPRDRAVRIARMSTGFLYYVSVTGITGTRDKLPAELAGELKWLRTQTSLPLCVGFGISKPEHVQIIRNAADGIIVGSALVRHLDQADGKPFADIAKDVAALCRTLTASLNP